MKELLYNLLIMPIQLIVEMTYSFMSRLLGNKGLAIIAVSLVVQTLVLPLYKRSDKLQEEERNKQKEMSYWVNHIKKSFKGDERFMILQTYYRQQNYKVIYSLKSSFSILLQIPFFLAAYRYLSNLADLSGVSFGPIANLYIQDRMIHVGGVYINLLPILMTVINMISGYIYTKGQPLKSKIQVYGLACVFLVLLYKSPAGLVLYWTMNNVYSLSKNIIMKLIPALTGKAKISTEVMNVNEDNDKYKSKLFWIGTCLLAYFWGIFIPLNVISASPAEFIVNGVSPMQYVFYSFTVFLGIFIVWFSVFYVLMTPKARRNTGIVLCGVFFVSVFNYMFYSNKLGTMSTLLVYEEEPVWSTFSIIINLIISFAIFGLIALLIKNKEKIGIQLISIVFLGTFVLACMNVLKVQDEMNDYRTNLGKVAGNEIFTLSTDGENVIVFMLDRAISGYIPYIFDENPEIAEAFSDFTYYPNTISYAGYTNFATPALFGGYEYTPTKMNERLNELLADKHNEALKVLPKLFSDQGYAVTVCDPPYAGYQWVSDLTIYDDIDNVKAYITTEGFRDDTSNIYNEYNSSLQNSRFVYFSIVKSCPVILQKELYNGGQYFSASSEHQLSDTTPELFLKEYSSLSNLCNMTKIADDDSNNLLVFQNATTHEPTLLKTPDYILSYDADEVKEIEKAKGKVINGTELVIEDNNQLEHYQCNVLALKEVALWLNYLRNQGAYDNTRIIICSDHGRDLGQFNYMKLNNGIDVQYYNSLLLVKDFGDKSYKVSDEFMTIADVPYLAVTGLIDNPVNPYTGNIIDNEQKKTCPQMITTSLNNNIDGNNGNVFDTSDGKWYTVENNIFDVDNWKEAE